MEEKRVDSMDSTILVLLGEVICLDLWSGVLLENWFSGDSSSFSVWLSVFPFLLMNDDSWVSDESSLRGFLLSESKGLSCKSFLLTVKWRRPSCVSLSWWILSSCSWSSLSSSSSMSTLSCFIFFSLEWKGSFKWLCDARGMSSWSSCSEQEFITESCSSSWDTDSRLRCFLSWLESPVTWLSWSWVSSWWSSLSVSSSPAWLRLESGLQSVFPFLEDKKTPLMLFKYWLMMDSIVCTWIIMTKKGWSGTKAPEYHHDIQ